MLVDSAMYLILMNNQGELQDLYTALYMFFYIIFYILPFKIFFMGEYVDMVVHPDYSMFSSTCRFRLALFYPIFW